MLDTHLVFFRVSSGESLRETDVELLEIFSHDIKQEIEEVAFDHLFRRSWKPGKPEK